MSSGGYDGYRYTLGNRRYSPLTPGTEGAHYTTHALLQNTLSREAIAIDMFDILVIALPTINSNRLRLLLMTSYITLIFYREV